MRHNPDPNDFVDVDEAFEEGYDPDEITLATFTIASGDSVDHATLEYRKGGVYGPAGAGKAGTEWAIGLYRGYHYNGDDIPIAADYAAHILSTLAGVNEDHLEEYDWTAQDWAYFE